ncbi:MAG: hypothetical protein B0A82_13965 [Alkalinema sp. CACIAM 70d]|nr:MAG: hypothetical protein B0A82_13965 [Alkalinema sp. CACIAM 70d]
MCIHRKYALIGHPDRNKNAMEGEGIMERKRQQDYAAIDCPCQILLPKGNRLQSRNSRETAEKRLSMLKLPDLII